MKKSLRLLALILALLMVIPLVVACDGKKDDGEDKDDPKATTAGDPAASGDDPAATQSPSGDDPSGDNPVVDSTGKYVSKLPATYDWEGDTCDILGRDGIVQFQNFEIWRDELPGDVVGKAVWDRNEALLRDYNFEVTGVLVENVSKEILTLLDSQDDVYDMAIYQPQTVQSHASSGYLLDLNSLPYLDFDHPTWNKLTNEQLTIADKLFYTTNDFLLQDKSRTFCMFYNRELAREFKLGYLEDRVDDHTWTLDYVNEIVHQFATEIDGVQGHSSDDGFGIAVTGTRSFAAFCYAAGFRISTNVDGFPSLVEPDKKMLDIIDKVGKFAFDKNVWLDPVVYDAADSLVFCAGNTLLYSCFPSVLESRLNENCHFEFGILPHPKYEVDPTQPYLTQINIMNGSLFAIPYTVADPARTAFYVEALSEYSVETTYDAFIETKCKVQDSYDELCARMLDLSIQNVAYDIVAICGYGGLYSVLGDDIPSVRLNVYKKLWDAKKKITENAIEELIAEYQSM